MQPLQYVSDRWLLCSCLRLFIVAICSQLFRQQVFQFNEYSRLNLANQFCRDWKEVLLLKQVLLLKLCCGKRWEEWCFFNDHIRNRDHHL